MFDVLKELLASEGYTVAESFTIPPCEARYRSVPRFLFKSRLGLYLGRNFNSRGLWNHQALALEMIGNKKNTVVSTATASGKSLIFRAASFHEVLLNPSSRVLVFYPLKALANDQLRGWRAMAEALGQNPQLVGRIDGSVPLNERDNILGISRILIMTPDVCHAWMMSRLSIPPVKEFLKNLKYLVLDEAHTLEGVFGSNFAFLLRRILTARCHLVTEEKDPSLQIIASTATISNPSEHMRTLTGMNFESIIEADDGSARAERFCAHVVSPVGEEMQVARGLQTALLKNSQQGGVITFVDSRKGVEALARLGQNALTEALGHNAIMPYRSGYDATDRENIERRLQSGNLRGVVSTSALELGIDLPHLIVGINVGVPPSRKAYRQRLGRVGRTGRGAFLIIANQNAFKSFGTSFKEYHELSVEPSYLYLDNRFMQFAHARCLADEVEALGASSSLPTNVPWPEGFSDVYAAAKPGGRRPLEFDAIAQLGGDTPQRSYPLRNVGEITFKIATGENVDGIGEVNESQCLRECYPGATYLHLGRAYEVLSWHMNAFRPYVKVRLTHPGRHTKPRIRTWINTGILPADLMEGHLLIGNDGFIAECEMQITEKVEGYLDQNGNFHSYQELRQTNPNMRSRQRNFRTSGVVLCVKNEWFKHGGVKQDIADWISRVFCREYSVLPQDIGSAATNISVRTTEGGGIRGDCLVVFDQTYGSLRLTERLFLKFPLILERLKVSANASDGPQRSQRLQYVAQLEAMYSDLQPWQDSSPGLTAEAPPDCVQVFTPQSIVCFREAGKVGTEVEVIRPTWMEGQLMYQVMIAPRYPGAPPGRRWVSAHSVEPSADADAWQYGWWNAETEEFIRSD